MNPNPNAQGLGTVLKHASQHVYQIEIAYWNKMVKGHLPCFPLVVAQSLLPEGFEDFRGS
jgi:hypothetical protein